MAKVVTSHSISSLENAQNIPMILEKTFLGGVRNKRCLTSLVENL